MENTSKPDENNSEAAKNDNINIEKLEPKKRKENIETNKKDLKSTKIEDNKKIKIEKNPSKDKTIKLEKEKESKIKDSNVKDNFRYIVRIANTDIDGDKTLERGLTSIKGIGMHLSTLVIDSSGLDRNIKMGDLTDKQIEKIQISLDNISNTAPNWMLNHQKDTETGENIHFIGSDIEMKLRDEINIMKKIRSYKGIRHERGLPVRGQRTRANNRKGLSLGVSKKGVQNK